MDFDIHFGIESNVFFDAWDKCKGNINNVLQLHKISNSTASGFDEEVDQFLSLLKLLPERQKGRKTAAMRLHFNDAIEKLVVYSKVLYYFQRKFKFFMGCHFKFDFFSSE